MGSDNFIKQELLIVPVAESSAETLNACGEAVRPVYLQVRVVEAGRTALIPTGDNSTINLIVLIVLKCLIWGSLSER